MSTLVKAGLNITLDLIIKKGERKMWFKDIGKCRIGNLMCDPVFIKFINRDKEDIISDWKYEIQFFNWFFCFGYDPI